MVPGTGILPPVGRSDHSSVLWRPKARSMINIPRPATTYKRAMPDSAILSFGCWISGYSWKPVLDASSTQSKADTFYSILKQQIETHFPSKKLKITASDKPWMTNNSSSTDSVLSRRTTALSGSSTGILLTEQYSSPRGHLLNENCLKPNPTLVLGTHSKVAQWLPTHK